MMERIRVTHLLPPVAAAALLYLWLGAPGSAVGQALPGILIPAPEGTVATFDQLPRGVLAVWRVIADVGSTGAGALRPARGQDDR